MNRLADIRSHLRSAAHQELDVRPDASDHELAEVVKDAASRLEATYAGGDITNIINAVRGERARRRDPWASVPLPPGSVEAAERVQARAAAKGPR